MRKIDENLNVIDENEQQPLPPWLTDDEPPDLTPYSPEFPGAYESRHGVTVYPDEKIHPGVILAAASVIILLLIILSSVLLLMSRGAI